jgi:hypothetical protein
VGREVASRQGIPLVVTVHGMYTDGLERSAPQTDLILAVSAAIRDLLVSAGAPAERVRVLPNGVDLERFQLGPGSRAERLALLSERFGSPVPQTVRWLVFVCRLDVDKAFILDVVARCWAEMVRTRSFDWRWLVAGDGSERERLEVLAREIHLTAGEPLIRFLGWRSEQDLAALYQGADLTVAPGRSALDCLACGRPVIAIGSRQYVGLVDRAGWLAGTHTNFGGVGAGESSHVPGRLFADIDEVIYDDPRLDRLGLTAAQRARAEHDQRVLDDRLVGWYRMLLAREADCHPPGRRYRPVHRDGFVFWDAQRTDELAAHWHLGPAQERAVSMGAEGGLRLVFRNGPEGKFYLTNGSPGFDWPGRGDAYWPVVPDSHYLLRTDLRITEGAPSVRVYVIEYDRTARTRDHVQELLAGQVEIPFSTASATDSIRVAIRFSGQGTIELGPLAVLLAQANADEHPVGLRSAAPVGHAGFQGQHLVFVLGAPRSGTTWVLKLLAEHPDVVAATVDNLGVRLNERMTLETNVFNPDRALTDEGIRHRFHALATRHPDRIIVEKTPIHLLFVDRIRRIFPMAALVLVIRDGRDVASSLVQVGRNPNAWWQGAPSTIEQAAGLWKRYVAAGRRCSDLYAPFELRYEQLLLDPAGRVRELVRWLGMSEQHAPAQVEACLRGRNILIPGVYREGRAGTWRGVFAPQDVDRFKAIAGEELIELGFETGDAWGLQA